MRYANGTTAVGILAISLLFSCNIKEKSENRITVFCAASLTAAIGEIKSDWEESHRNDVVLNLASSGTLARQIEYGADADIFLSADQEWMKYVVEILHPKNNPLTIAENKLVAIVPVQSNVDSMAYQSFLNFLGKDNSKITIGDPGHVPLGKYTKSALEAQGIFDELTSRFILAKDARNTLRLVELEEASIGVVYLTDARSSSKVKVIAEVPSHQVIGYEIILLDDQNDAAFSLYTYLTSESARKIWLKHGFIL